MNSARKKPTKKYIKNGESPAYLSTIKRIVDLKESLDNDEELQDLMILQFYNERKKSYDEIKWKDFFVDYNIEQYEYIYKLIQNKRAYHPICFSGKIKELKDIGNRRYIIKFYSLKKVEGEYF